MRQAIFEDEPKDPFDDPEIQELIEAGARYGWDEDGWNRGLYRHIPEVDDEMF